MKIFLYILQWFYLLRPLQGVITGAAALKQLFSLDCKIIPAISVHRVTAKSFVYDQTFPEKSSFLYDNLNTLRLLRKEI